ncbi:hypothetical protein KEM55_004246, partial [Ascosphaera atra]
MSAPSVPRAAPSGEPSAAGPPTAPNAPNPDHRLRHRPLIDECQMWVDTVEDGVTGNHWVANLSYAPLRELLEGLGERPFIRHIDFVRAPPAAGTNPERAFPVIQAMSPAAAHKCTECTRHGLFTVCAVHPVFSARHGDTPPPTTQATRGVNAIITSAARAFQVLAPVLRGVGLRLAYADDPSYAQDPDPPFEEKLRLMVGWARDMDRVLVDRAWYEDALRYLTGAHLKGVQRQIAADPRVSARCSSDVFDPPLAAEQSSRPTSSPRRKAAKTPSTPSGSPSPSPPSPDYQEESEDAPEGEGDNATSSSEGEQSEAESGSESDNSAPEEKPATDHHDGSGEAGSGEPQGGVTFHPDESASAQQLRMEEMASAAAAQLSPTLPMHEGAASEDAMAPMKGSTAEGTPPPDSQGSKRGERESSARPGSISLSTTPQPSSRALLAQFNATWDAPSPSAVIEVPDSPTPGRRKAPVRRQSTLLEAFLKKAPQRMQKESGP